MIKAIIGLGNPGSKFEYNRHNIGFRVVDALAEHYNANMVTTNDLEWARIKIDSNNPQLAPEIYLVKPTTFMNNSGRAISFLTKKGIQPQEMLVVHDELEKSFGQLTIKCDGSARGHNGLRSIIATIGSQFWRLRFGIGRPENREEVPDYVLSNFSRVEEERLSGLIDDAINLILTSNFAN